jgi:AraC-like DNA-binding protein
VTTGSVPSDLLPHLRRARDLIDGRYAEPLDLTTLAAAARCSAYHFLRSFAAVYGETPARYLTRRRVERASELLRSANLTVTEVCHLVGFASLGTFSTRFKQLVGMPPSVYQRRARERGGPPPVPGCFVLMWSAPQSGRSAGPAQTPNVRSDRTSRRNG